MLTNKKREFLYAMSAFGPNLIMTMLMAYYLNAMNPDSLRESINLWAWAPVAIVSTSAFAALWTIGRVFNSVIDIPVASMLDRMKNRYARIRLPILIAFVPIVLSTIALCLPISMEPGSIINTVQFFVMIIIFFLAYTMLLVAFYASLSTVCKDRKQRARIAFYKSFIDTVQYALAYAATPGILSALKNTDLNVMHVTLFMTPLLCTILIPVIMSFGKKAKAAALGEGLGLAAAPIVVAPAAAVEAAEIPVVAEAPAVTPEVQAIEAGGKKAKKKLFDDTPEQGDEKVQKVGIFKSIGFVLSNRAFWPWCLVAFIYFMGLQLFLTSQNALISGVLYLDTTWAMILNIAAFGPVPVMLWLYNKLLKKKGIRFSFQVALLCFGVGIGCFSLGSAYFFPNDIWPRIVINMIGGTISSFAIGAFFMMPVMISSQVGAVDRKVTKRNNSGMYFAGQGICMGIGASISTGLIWELGLKKLGDLPPVKTIFDVTHVDYVKNILGGWDKVETIRDFYTIPLGGFIAPFVVTALCLIAFGVAFLLPKSYDTKTIGKLFDKNYVPDAEDIADAEVAEETAAESVEPAAGQPTEQA